MKRYLTDCSNDAKLIFMIGLLVGMPIVVIPFYPDELRYMPAFLIPMLVSFLIGATFNLFASRKDEDEVREWQSPLQKGSVPVLMAWCYAIFAGATPFVISGQLDVLLGVFEAVSGWTTTGLTVVDVKDMPHVFLFHRSFMQYCGGLGFVMMMVMLTQGKQSMSLYNAEGHPDRLKPNLKQSSRTIFELYNGFLLVGIVSYRAFGMNLFESICHSMSALSTAGFATREGSIGEYGSYPIEMVTIVLMLVGSTNFAILELIRRRRFQKAFRVSEVRFLGLLLLFFVPLSAFSLVKGLGMDAWEGLHQSLFGLVSVFSTTGYSGMDYSSWPPFATGLLMVMMVVGGGAGSTAGGVKLLRVYLMVRFVRGNIRKRLYPTRNVTAPYYYRAQGKTLIDEEVLEDAIGFGLSYVGILLIGTLLLTLTADCTLFEAMFEFTSAFGTVGISNGLTNPNAGVGTLVVQIIGMILGRLEIFIIFIGIYTGLRTGKRKIQYKLRNRS